MSMNLKCDQMELWQSPTHITNICYYTVKKDTLVKDTWKSIRFRYREWVLSTLNGCYKSDKEIQWYENQKILVNEHIHQLYSHPKLTFYII